METTRKLTGFPHIDKPWLRFYSEEQIHSEIPHKSLYRYIYDINEPYLHEKAVTYYGTTRTYGEFFQDIDEIGRAFTALGIGYNDPVLMSTVNCPEAIEAIYAVNKIGGIGNLIDPRSDNETLRHYVEQVDAKVFVTIDVAYPHIAEAVKDTSIETIIVLPLSRSMNALTRTGYKLKERKSIPKIEFNEHVLDWDTFLEKGQNAPSLEGPFEWDRCTLIEHTGGTTGKSKSAMLCDNGINAVIQAHTYTGVPIERCDTYFSDMPPFILYGFAMIHMCLGYGAEILLFPKFDPAGFPKLFKKYKPNHICAILEHFKNMADAKCTQDMNLAFLKTVCVGGDKVPEDVENRINDYMQSHGSHYTMIQGYGMTELSPTATTTTQSISGEGTAGIPLVYNTIRISDPETGKPLRYNNSGEIWINSPGIMLGYLGDQEATDELIVTDEEGKRWIRTGDLGYVTNGGRLYIEGRLRRIYITADEEGNPAKLFPFVPEQAILNNEAVDACNVVGRKKANSTVYEAVAFVVKMDDQKSNDELEAELREICLETVASYMQPVQYVFLDAIPHTPRDKVDFKKLEKMAAKMSQN